MGGATGGSYRAIGFTQSGEGTLAADSSSLDSDVALASDTSLFEDFGLADLGSATISGCIGASSGAKHWIGTSV